MNYFDDHQVTKVVVVVPAGLDGVDDLEVVVVFVVVGILSRPTGGELGGVLVVVLLVIVQLVPTQSPVRHFAQSVALAEWLVGHVLELLRNCTWSPPIRVVRDLRQRKVRHNFQFTPIDGRARSIFEQQIYLKVN